MKKQELAIVTGVGYGNRDFRGAVGLWFGVEMLVGGALCFFGVDAKRVIRESDCYDIRELEGRMCVVETDGPLGTVSFVRWHQAGKKA